MNLRVLGIGLLLVTSTFLVVAPVSAKSKVHEVTQEIKLKNAVVEASCGQCHFGLKKKGCDLAIRYQGKAYFVEGVKIDDFGDAHANDGFCMALRQARVTGVIVGDTAKIKSFKLLPEK